jgi:hypothetical protein
MASASDLIKGALRRINSYQSGEPLQQPDAQDALDCLNDWLDSLSLDKDFIYGSVENVLSLNSNQAAYRIGNPMQTALGEPPFIGTLTGGSNVITGVTQIPSDLVAGTSANNVGSGSNLIDTAGVIPPGTYVTAFNAGAQTVTMSQNATATPANNPEGVNYSIPGDWAIPRPNRITHGFTRFSQLDFSCEVLETQSRFLEILYKAQPGPWPTVAWYNPLMPYGVITFYQTPGNSAPFHLFTDTILQNLTINQTFVLPSGYSRAIKWALAKEICAEYGYPMTEAIKTNADDSMKLIKALNAKPAEKARYDRMLLRGRRRDASFIFHGGYN